MKKFTAVLAILAVQAVVASAGVNVSPRLTAQLATAGEGARIYAWVTFTDKGPQALLKESLTPALVSPAALERRRNVLPENMLVDETDLPVAPSYVAAITATGALIRQQSKWLNAVSVSAIPSQIDAIRNLPCVRDLDLVARFRRDTLEMKEASHDIVSLPGVSKVNANLVLDYGPSLTQVAQIHVPEIHQTGNHAQGVIVGVFDDGVRLLSHTAFDSLRPRIVGQHDFVDKKTSVIPNQTGTAWGFHGVNTLSVIGGYAPGKLIGPAFGASFILARTEYDSTETPFEEDNWVAAIEWAESLGVQVTSTSLGYLNYDSPYPSWSWQDMNGHTTKISKAAVMAARKGVVVVNSAGNNGSSTTVNTLNAPADADSILTVGAVNGLGVRASFSSVGPTTDVPARIKPDVMAMGVSDAVASQTDPIGYTTMSGTSFSCPLAAGVAALMVRAMPHATPMQIINAIKSTADNADAPNNLNGWGIINAAAALTQLTGVNPGGDPRPASFTLGQNFPNPFNPTTKIQYSLAHRVMVKLAVYDVLGREVAVLINSEQETGNREVLFDATGLSSGVYFYRLQAGSFGETKRLLLLK